MRVKIKTWPKPETAYEKTLAPRVVNIIVKVQEISKQSTTLVYNMHVMTCCFNNTTHRSSLFFQRKKNFQSITEFTILANNRNNLNKALICIFFHIKEA